MVQFASGNLRDLTNRPVVTGKPIYATNHEAWRNDTERAVVALNDYWQALANLQAGSSQPVNKTRGSLWADTTTAAAVALYLDPDGEGADDQVATRLTAKDISFKTGGTATFKLGGAIDVNTTQATGPTLMNYTVPGNTLSLDQSVLFNLAFGTGGGTSLRFEFRDITDNAPSNAGLNWWSKVYWIRTGASTSKYGIASKCDNDAAGDTNSVNSATSATSNASSTNLTYTQNSGITQEIMLTKLLQ